MISVQVPRRFVLSHWGGTESVILETSRRLLAQGHPTEILCPAALSPVRDEVIEGVRVRRFPYFYPYLGLSSDARHLLDLKGGNLFSFGLLGALLRQPGLQVIHLHTGMRLGGIVRTAARLRGIPYVVSVHGGRQDAPDAERRSYTDPTRGTVEWGRALGALVGSHRVMDDAAAVLVLGRREEEDLRRVHPGANVVYFPNGVDADRFATGDGAAFRARHGIPPGDRIVLCVGRLDPQKNQVLAVRVLAALLPRHPGLRLVLAGHVTNEEYAEKVVAETRALGVEDRVTIVRGIPVGSPDLVDAYHAADVFLLPSIHEPFGIVILEAWAAGLPVVASRVGGVPDFVRDSDDGLLVDPGRVEDVCQRVSELLDAPEAARRMGQAGRIRARGEFSWDAATRRLVGIYEEAARARSVRP
jgi:glycosyltransferase involved in cell wall biosynthesis